MLDWQALLTEFQRIAEHGDSQMQWHELEGTGRQLTSVQAGGETARLETLCKAAGRLLLAHPDCGEQDQTEADDLSRWCFAIERRLSGFPDANIQRGKTGDDQNLFFGSVKRFAKHSCDYCCELRLAPSTEELKLPRVPHVESKTTATESQPEVDGSQNDKTRDEILKELHDSVRDAYVAYKAAECQSTEVLKRDDDVYDYLKAEGIPDGIGLDEYLLPSLGTWKRQVRVARKALGEQKNKRRAGRTHGKSIVRQEEI